VKNSSVIKGIQFEGLRVMGAVPDLARKYYLQGADEIVIMDAVASLYGRDAVLESIYAATSDIFIPITAGGGIRTVDDAVSFFDAGADRVAINSQAIRTPQILGEISRIYGAQAVVLSIEARKVSSGSWSCFFEAGREDSGLSVLKWAAQASDFGVGEILVTSVDMDGTMQGPDLELAQALRDEVNLPIMYSGGVGKASEVGLLFDKVGVAAVAVGSALHYGGFTVPEIKDSLELLLLAPRR
jgi:imidazoleglycerol phosphate synthase cyclase subunit